VADGYDQLDLGQLLQARDLVLPLVLQNRAENSADMPCIELPVEGSATCAGGQFNGAAVTFPDVFNDAVFPGWMRTGQDKVEGALNIPAGRGEHVNHYSVNYLTFHALKKRNRLRANYVIGKGVCVLKSVENNI
jgi:hypothetical protein